MRTCLVNAVLWSVLWVGVSGAEMRTWTSAKGDTIEAEYVRFIGDKVELKSRAGKTLKIPVSGLCAEDQNYLASIVPPKIDIDVNIDSKSAALNEHRKVETVKCSVGIKKTNAEPCTREFVVYSYIFAKSKKGVRWLFGDDKKTFLFTDGAPFQFQAPHAKLEYAGGSEFEFRYEGYLVVVTDDTDQMVAMASNQRRYEKNWSTIKGAKKGAQFDESFRLMDETRKWGVPPYISRP